MEKLVYCLWKQDGTTPSDFGRELRGALADVLEAGGARGLRVFVADEEIAAGEKLRLSAEAAHKDGYVSFWLEASQDREALESEIARRASRIAGYLVVESRPMIPPGAGEKRGRRSPGWVQVTGISPREGLAYDEFLHHWYDVHRQVAIDTQSSTAYVRNEIVRPLTPDAPVWAAVVEETFPIEALSDPRVFYDGRGSEERFRENAQKMFESVQAFLDLGRVDAHPMSEYVFGDLP